MEFCIDIEIIKPWSKYDSIYNIVNHGHDLLVQMDARLLTNYYGSKYW